MKPGLIFALFCFFSGLLFSQEDYAVEWELNDYFIYSLYNNHMMNTLLLAHGEGEEVSLIFNISPSDTVAIVTEFSPDGDSAKGYFLQMYIDTLYYGVTKKQYLNARGYSRKSDWHGVVFNVREWNDSNSIVFSYKIASVFNFKDDKFWAKKVTGNYKGRVFESILPDDRMMVDYHLNEAGPHDSLTLAIFDLASEALVWSNAYTFSSVQPDSGYTMLQASVFPNGDLSLLGADLDKYPLVDGPFNFLTYSFSVKNFFLLRLDSLGEVVRSVRLFNDSLKILRQEISEEGDVYLFGRVENDLSLYHDDPGWSDFFVAKLNADYQLQWIKRLYAEGFSYYTGDIKAIDDGTLAFTMTMPGAFPVIYGRINSDGELLFYTGQTLAAPLAGITDQGSLYMHSVFSFEADGTLNTNERFLVKTKPDGTTTNCPALPACVELRDDLSLQVEAVEWNRTPVQPVFDTVEVAFSPLSATVEPYCDTSLEPPTPYFLMADTVCVGSCLSPDSLSNQLANYITWHIVGPEGIDTLIRGEATFDMCFDVPGIYEIEQTIWLLGCDDSFLHELVVLPDDLDLLGADRTLCEEPPFNLSANAERPLTSYLWSDGSTAPELEVNSSGTYNLEASDGYCTLRDTVALTFLQDLLTEGPPLTLPADTVACEQHLPYVLAPYSPYTEIPPQQLWQAGSYAVEAEIFGCPFLENFELSLSDCRSRIYLPTAFSPNGDGLNDLFLPQGKDYEGIELQVYDRWGGLLYSTREVPFAWDGGDAPAGVYTWLFRYLNTLSGEEEVLSGEVNLVR